MAITTNVIVPVKVPLEGDWVVASLYSADLSGAEDLVAAVTGKSIYVQKVQIFAQSVTDITVTLGSAQSTGVTTIYLGPIPLPDAGGSALIDFGPDHAMKIAVSTTFAIDASASCPITVLVWYKYAD